MNDGRVGPGLGAVDGILVARSRLEQPLKAEFEIDGIPFEGAFGPDYVEQRVEHLEIYRPHCRAAQAGMGYVLKH